MFRKLGNNGQTKEKVRQGVVYVVECAGNVQWSVLELFSEWMDEFLGGGCTAQARICMYVAYLSEDACARFVTREQTTWNWLYQAGTRMKVHGMGGNVGVKVAEWFN